MQKTIEIEIGSGLLKIETHRWAKQSNGSAVLTYKDNVMLVTANMKEDVKEGQDFLPLMVDFRENNYAAGKIPGGFFKREGKPSEREILLSRLIDRPIRPLFPDNFHYDTQVIAMLLSADFSTDYDSMGIIGASAALLSSTIAFSTPVGAVKIGRINDEFVVNPGEDNKKELEFVIQIAGTEDDIVMLEAGGNEFSEDLFKEALKMGKEIITKICISQKELINPDKIQISPDTEAIEIFNQIKEKYEERLKEAIFTVKKLERKEKVKTIADEIFEPIKEEDDDEGKLKKYQKAFDKLEYEVFRKTLLAEKKRNDGRAFDEIRSISIELGMLPRTHGSAVFTRGETQALATVTLGSEDDAQRMDTLASTGEELKRFMLHYNFPPFSVGEVNVLRGTGRREVGHGNLAEKSLLRVLPKQDEFPYTIRIVSDILESNGSSSMATVCGGTLALLDAGVPITAPLAGIAMGLVKENDDFVVLTDIAGYEDHFGDMDFKITGTEKGITAVQLDIKINGLNDAIIDKTLDDAKKARLFILEKIKEAIPVPAKTVSEYAPVIMHVNINTEKIRDLIGPSGKTIKGLVAEFGAKINTDDDGKVTIAAANKQVGEAVIERILQITASAEIGKIYDGKITRIEDYGVFVEIFKGAVGLVHISELSPRRVGHINDLNLKLGQEMKVKVISIDKDNRIKLSKRATEETEGSAEYTREPREHRENRDSRDSRD
ncbi:MAG TPA: polyribonucleotide nucleotidyltransferase, partial [Candidatus Deferrimicrobium sp.]|nr:polyribonucleotide nucleotidyltransferase [Candidatus Deferrimicrobium sp.]